MKKTYLTIALTAAIIGSTIFTSCKSADEKAEEKVEDAQQDLEKAQQDKEWIEFKAESEAKIKENNDRIAELREKMNKPGKVLDPLYEKKIDTLEEKNRELQVRLDAEETDRSNWEEFKREFNHDMDEIGQALKDLTVNNEN